MRVASASVRTRGGTSRATPIGLSVKIEWGLFMLNKSAMLRLTFAAASLMGAANLALAGTATTTFPVSAAVSKSCIISATALAFGAYDPIGTNATNPLNGSGTVSVACTKGSASVTIGMNNGTNPSGAQRRLLAAGPSADLLLYNLYQPTTTAAGAACPLTAGTTWDNSTTLGITPPENKNARTYNVCGSIPAGQDPAAGEYADTVTATINF